MFGLSSLVTGIAVVVGGSPILVGVEEGVEVVVGVVVVEVGVGVVVVGVLWCVVLLLLLLLPLWGHHVWLLVSPLLVLWSLAPVFTARWDEALFPQLLHLSAEEGVIVLWFPSVLGVDLMTWG